MFEPSANRIFNLLISVIKRVNVFKTKSKSNKKKLKRKGVSNKNEKLQLYRRVCRRRDVIYDGRFHLLLVQANT